MKKRNYSALAMMALLVLFSAMTARAQSSGHGLLVANIPFEFKVGKAILPAGEYTVNQVNPAAPNAVLQIRSVDGRAGAMVQMTQVAGKKDESTRLIFNRYGNRYFFAEAWMDNEGAGLQAPKLRDERAMERELAGVKAQREQVALATRAN